MTDDLDKISCETCKKEIPRDVAVTAEGAEYVYHYCCPDCMDHYAEEHPELKLDLKQ